MIQEYFADHKTDENGNPNGGTTTSTGLSISWQKGSLGHGECRQEPNGAFVETVIASALNRLEYYQRSKFACEENAIAVKNLEEALYHLNRRSAGRILRGVEGTHTV